MSTLYWFSNDLRIDDNSLLARIIQEHKSIHCCFIVDPRWLNSCSLLNSSLGLNRWRFLKQSLEELTNALAQINISLKVYFGKPENILPRLVDKLAIETLGCARQVGYQENQCLKVIQKMRPHLTIEMVWLNTLFQEDFIVNTNAVAGSYSKFRKVAEKRLKQCSIAPLSSAWLFNEQRLQGSKDVKDRSLHDTIKLVDECFPCQASSKQAANNSTIIGGCYNALTHLNNYLSSGTVDHYKQTRNDLHGLRRSTLFSPWLALGCISAKQIWQAITNYEQLNHANASTYCLKLELLWREYFQWLALAKGRYLFTFEGGSQKAPQTSFHPERFEQWRTGNTEYSLVNALMKQLNSTGFMSNRGRQIVASCFVNELALDWRYGASYFEKQLIDYDVASNWGNWQYIAGVGADPRGGRWFNIEKQRQYYDRDGEFIKKWCGNKHSTPAAPQNANHKQVPCDVN